MISSYIGAQIIFFFLSLNNVIKLGKNWKKKIFSFKFFESGLKINLFFFDLTQTKFILKYLLNKLIRKYPDLVFLWKSMSINVRFLFLLIFFNLITKLLTIII